MKKLLVVLLAVVLVFGFAATAMAADTLSTAYPDLNGKTQTVQDAFMKLTALDVFGGYPDGTIQPEGNITRAEFAKVACILAGMADSADVLKGSASKFSDVAAGQWYTGYVNLATSLGFVHGYPDGTYKPNNNISMQEALTVLLRIAGYNDNLVGPWPLNYIAQGGKLDVTDDVAFAGAAPATRAAIAVMAANVLDLNVVYWDGDKSKFVEDTQKVDGDDVAITVLEDNFGAISESVTIKNWQFDDFDDQELSIDCWGSDNYELAEKYWVTNGFVIWSFGNMEADLLMNEDGEVVFIDVTATFVFSDDVTTDGDSVDVGGDVADYADDHWGPTDLDGDYAKVYYNADGDVYKVTELGFSDGEPSVFETYNENKDRIENYNASNIPTDEDIAIIKNGQFITAADLKDGDLLNYIGDAEGSAYAAYVVTPFKEGELTKGTSTALTIGDTALVYDHAAYTDGARYSADAMDSFEAIDAPGDVDDAYDTTVQYATALGNPFDLALLIFEGGESTTLYGIITDVTANIDGLVSTITVLGADGEEVEYSIVKVTGYDRPDYESYSDIYYSTSDWDLTFGSYIEAKVSEDGTIGTDDIVVLVDPMYYGDYYNWDYDLEYYDGDYEYESATVDINNNRIQLDGVYYTLTDDTLVFAVTMDGGLDTAEVIDVADLMAADEISDGYVLAFVDSGVCQQIYLLDTDFTSTSAFGVIDSFSYYSGDWYVALLDGSEYTISDTNYDDYDGDEDQVFISYTLSGDNLTADTPPVVYTGWCGEEETDVDVYFDGYYDGDDYFYGDRQFIISNETEEGEYGPIAFDATANGDIMTINGINYTVTDDTVFYVVSDATISEGDIYDFEDNQTGVLCLTTDTPEDCILEYVFIVQDQLCGFYTMDY